MDKIIFNFPINVIFLDWDDTLFPTTIIINESIRQKTDLINIKINEKLKNELFFLEVKLIELINFLSIKGQIYIITNATKDWVYESCKKYFPTFFNKFFKIDVISALDTYGNNFHIDDIKYIAMKKIILNFYNKKINIISIGDSDYEKNSIIKISKENLVFVNNTIVIKLQINPSTNILHSQLCTIKNNYDIFFNKYHNVFYI